MNNKIIVYHCSPYRIYNFDFKNGVHFGSKKSAIKAGKRKQYMLREYKGNRDTSLFLYTFELDINKQLFNFQETDDMGDSWLQYKEHEMVRDQLDGLIYKNKYEPSIYPSYYIINPSCILLKCVQEI